MPRYLGVDLGTVRIGLALSEPGGIVSPLAVVPARPTAEENAREILKAAADYDVDGIVIGLPLNMDDTEGPQAKLSRKLAEAIERLAASGGSRRPLAIHLHDERLTSFDADQRLIGRELTRKKKKARQDALAAQVLLQSFLETHPPQ